MTGIPTAPDSWTARAVLPTGCGVLIEASAGTGKTYQTAGLVVRLVTGLLLGTPSEPVDMAKILVITFSRAAAAELRDRVRGRLVLTRNRLMRVLSGEDAGTAAGADDYLLLILEGEPGVLQERLNRAQDALANYDQATIATIHSFCQEMLQLYSMEAGLDPRGAVQADAEQLVERAVGDLQAAILANGSADACAILAGLGWTADRGIAEVTKHASKVDAGELEPASVFAAPEQSVPQTARWMLQQAVDHLPQAILTATTAYQELQSPPLEDHLARFSLVAAKWKKSRDRGPFWNKQTEASAELASWLQEGAWDPDAAGAKLFAALVTAHDRFHQLSERDHAWVLTKVPDIEPTLEALQQWATSLKADLADTRPSVLAGALHCAIRVVQSERMRRGWQTFDSMISDLAAALNREAESSRKPLTKAIRRHYDVAIVDEFQDTDSGQWAILQKVFVESPSHRLIAVGDPKQSIYRFRGANLGVYQAARAGFRQDANSEVYSLGTNFRSDPKILAAINQLWEDGAWAGASLGTSRNAFGIDALRYHPIQSGRAGSADLLDLQSLDISEPVELRWINEETLSEPPEEPPVEGDAPELSPLKKGATQTAVAKACAKRVYELLQLETVRFGDQQRRLRPSDFAILVRTGFEAKLVTKYLQERTIPSIYRGKQSLFHTPAVPFLQAWLAAVAAPDHEAHTRAVALTPLVGWTGAHLAAQTEGAIGPDWSQLRADIRKDAETWPKQGFAKRFHRFLSARGGIARLLAMPAGEALASDLIDLVDACDQAQRIGRLSASGLAAWLTQTRAATPKEDEDTAVQLHTDASAVVVTTIHKSKGLEFPFVMVPFSWYAFSTGDGHNVLRYSQGEKLIANFAPKGSIYAGKTTHSREEALARVQAEDRQEAMRLLYVALTRAKHKLVLWGAHHDSPDAPLARLLDIKDAHDRISRAPQSWPAALDTGVARIDEPFDLDGLPAKWSPPPPEQAPPNAPLPWNNRLHQTWQIASYTSLSASMKPKGAPETIEDEDVAAGSSAEAMAADPSTPETDTAATPVPTRHLCPEPLLKPRPPAELLEPVLGEPLIGGPQAGSWVHSVLEDVAFQPTNGRLLAKDGRPLDVLLTNAAHQHGVGGPHVDPDRCHHQVVKRLLPEWLSTPLSGPRLPSLRTGYSLSDLKPSDRIDELEFDLRLGGGHGGSTLNRTTRPKRDDALRASLSTPSPAAQQATRAWLNRILARERIAKSDSDPSIERVSVLPAVEGFLTGKIDLVFRIPQAGVESPTATDYVYFLADYKTNSLAGTDRMKSANDGWGRVNDPARGGTRTPRLRRWHYTDPVMAWCMEHSAYHLQSLLYSVALDRFLQARLGSAYNPDVHFGGHLYLFLRGMEGTSPTHDGTRHALGVWADRWSPTTIRTFGAALTESPGGTHA
mgnify:CR=1 FL=1